jgi:hypothetical protein
VPNRIIREGFLDSEAIHALSDAAECFYHRLLLAADDAGRIDGRVEILRARLFPLDSSRRASDVEKALSESLAQGLVIPYEWKGQRFLQITRWQRCSPCVTSKYPWSDGSHRIAYVKVDTRDGEKDFVETSIPYGRDSDGIGTVIPRKAGDVDGYGDVDDGPPASADDLFAGVSPQIAKDFKAIRKGKKAAITKTAIDGIRREATKAGLTLESALAICCERGWSGFKAEWVAGGSRQEPATLPRLKA